MILLFLLLLVLLLLLLLLLTIAAAADSLSNTIVREGDDSGSILSDKNVGQAEIKKKAPISTVLQSCKLSLSAPKLPPDECLRDKYLRPVPKRKKAVQSQEDALSKKKQHAKKNLSNKQKEKRQSSCHQI